jgi:hypothetical protein
MCLRALSFGYSVKLEEVPALIQKKKVKGPGGAYLIPHFLDSINPSPKRVQKCFKRNYAKADDQDSKPYSR